ncbi:LemA family protein [Anabaenopsis tanganyikae CS-531]|uniref:LemA family protein n=2 Tax=Anabaenopsis TaxID=110103 RepID=A0ABT6KCK2_9CYAN|nr:MULTISPECIES: LemA family protein [Anabaenopsis]MDB9540172.1 LemA family protein [Anabaenopsis arnoldii]MDH6092567.1 LemA family protein [Anabaenopsis arnoldii]MDH6105585.1 LemA family protein [Anabaenopsis tanganyikae CS-531]
MAAVVAVAVALVVVGRYYDEQSRKENSRRNCPRCAGVSLALLRLAVERRRYNQAVQAYNQKVQSFPNSLVANMFGFEKREFFR